MKKGFTLVELLMVIALLAIKELKPKHAKLTSIWEIRPEQGHKEHPAVFPIELPTRIIASLL
jgi:prepilin-type N-terminal cleavage/methylation domain-containing protein